MPDTSIMLWVVLFGSIGFAYFIYGKRQSNVVARYAGIVLMVFPYFIKNVYALVAVGIVLISLPYFTRK